MIQVFPFRGWRPPPELAPLVASRPYDVVTTAEAAELAEENPLSFLHVVRAEIDLPPGTDPHDASVYEKARENLQRLFDERVLILDDEPSLYLYRLQLEDHIQIGLVCCCAVDDYDNGLIKKHEHTRRDKEDDRTRHILTTGAQCGPVLITYRQVGRIDELVAAETARDPLYDFEADDEVVHTVWRVTRTAPFVEAFHGVPALYIADGHHRAASASRARAERRRANRAHRGDEEYNRFLAVLFPDTQMQTLAYNRVVTGLNGLDSRGFLDAVGEVFEVTPDEPAVPAARGQITMFFEDCWYGLMLPPGVIDDEADPVARLDVSVLQDYLLGPILGIQDPRTDERIGFVGGFGTTEALLERVRSGQADVAFCLHPVWVAELMAIADSGRTMPPKSTWFEPKLRSGLLVHRI